MAMAWRVVTWSFRADAAGLVIHNILRTRRVPVRQVVGFDVGGSRIDRDMVSVRVITVSGTYRITVFGRRLFMFPGRLGNIADDLQAWLEDARSGLTS